MQTRCRKICVAHFRSTLVCSAHLWFVLSIPFLTTLLLLVLLHIKCSNFLLKCAQPTPNIYPAHFRKNPIFSQTLPKLYEIRLGCVPIYYPDKNYLFVRKKLTNSANFRTKPVVKPNNNCRKNGLVCTFECALGNYYAHILQSDKQKVNDISCQLYA